jgi:erythromycin esterase
MLAACAPAGDPTETWVRDNVHPVALEAEDFADLEFLRPLLEGRRIVQLGENAHGIREYNLLKARLVQFLHQELGYDVLAFESAVYQCYDANLGAAEAPAISTLTNCAYGVWHTEGVVPLFEYLRGTQQGDRPLLLAGFDVQPIGNNKEARPQFLSGVVGTIDPDYAAEVLTLDSSFLEVYARGGRERRAFFKTEDGRRLAEAYDLLEAFLTANGAAIEAAIPDRGRAVAVARRTAASMAWYIRQQSAPTTREYVERRDRGMAENLISLIDGLAPNRKVIVWGHNFHLRHDNLAIPPRAEMFPNVAARTMGSWLREKYGDELYTVGLYAYRGQAMDNSGKIYTIELPEAGSLESRLHEVGVQAAFLDFSRAPRGSGTAWIDQPTTARHDGTTPLSMVLRDQYDAVLVVDEVTPRVMLY